MPDTRLREWAREHLPEVEEWAVERAGESLVRRCAEIARHFANDELNREEWPPHGIVKREGRFDQGMVGLTADNIERAILRAYGLSEEGRG